MAQGSIAWRPHPRRDNTTCTTGVPSSRFLTSGRVCTLVIHERVTRCVMCPKLNLSLFSWDVSSGRLCLNVHTEALINCSYFGTFSWANPVRGPCYTRQIPQEYTENFCLRARTYKNSRWGREIFFNLCCWGWNYSFDRQEWAHGIPWC